MHPQRQAARSQPEARHPFAPRVAWRGQTILLVEDDQELRRMLASALRRDGFAVEEAANGDAALDWLDAGVRVGNLERLPDLIVSDIRLPYFSGLEILESLEPARARVPVILITGFPDEETHARARALGAECVLEKPFDLGQLRAAVHLALRTNGRDAPGTRGLAG